MVRLTFGDIEIDVDVEATRQYYQKHLMVADNQSSRNFIAFCDTLTPVENNFFESLGIDVKAVQLMDGDFFSQNQDKTVTVGIRLFISGKFHKKAPPFSLEEWQALMEKGYPFPDANVYVGRFQIQFNEGDEDGNCAPEKPKDFPEPAIQIGMAADIPWLLNEKCEAFYGYALKPWQIIKKIKNKKYYNKYAQNALDAAQKEQK